MCFHPSQESEDEDEEDEDEDEEDDEEEDDENGDSSEDGGDSSESSSEDESEDGDEVGWMGHGRGGGMAYCQDGPLVTALPLSPRTRRTMRMRMMTRTTTRMRTTNPRAAAPAPPPRGTPQTLTPTEAQPYLGLPSPTDHLCFSPMFCPLPLGLPHFLSFFLFF